MRTSPHMTARIEGLLTTHVLTDLTESIDIVIDEMIEEGWEYEEISDYLLDKIGCAVISHQMKATNDDSKQHVIGKQVIITDECISANNIKIHTVVDFDPTGIIWFEGEQFETHFTYRFDLTAFMDGYKVFIHDNEVSIQLVN